MLTPPRVVGLVISFVLVASACGDSPFTAADGAESGDFEDAAFPESSDPTAAERSVGPSDASLATVARVIDGDSVELDFDGRIVESRLVGINAPELADCQGPAARDALGAVVQGQELRVEDFGTDRFGRLLVNLLIDADSVNRAMVRAGWALALHGDEADWTADMKAAADAGLGMWDLPEECPLPEAEVAIADVEPDPPGPDDEALEDEWIELENRGDAAVDLTGWAVRDESTSNRFVFDGPVLQPGERIRLRTGCGQDTPDDLYWCSRNGVWSNRGETALLLGPSGAIVDVRHL